jgi:hypothetical protein
MAEPIKLPSPALTGTAKRSNNLTVMNFSPKAPPPLPSVGSRSFAKQWQTNMTYLQGVLPEGSLRYGIQPKRFGNHLGVPCVCPYCEIRPPKFVRPWNRWRWMNFHQITEHVKGYKTP